MQLVQRPPNQQEPLEQQEEQLYLHQVLPPWAYLQHRLQQQWQWQQQRQQQEGVGGQVWAEELTWLLLQLVLMPLHSLLLQLVLLLLLTRTLKLPCESRYL